MVPGETEICELWGESATKWPRFLTIKLGLLPDEQHLLEDVGFPVDLDWTFDFASSEPVSRDSKFIVFGFDGGMALAIDPSKSRTIWCLEDQENVSVARPVNSSLVHFIECLAIYYRYRQRVRKLASESDIFEEIEATERDFRASDPIALGAEDSYWCLILEQMHAGLL